MCENKGALSLIALYGDDNLTDDEDVLGSRVSTKRERRDSSDEDNERRKLPVPNLFLKPNNESYIDRPDDHNGRIRSFPHERGNWATYIYLPFEDLSLDELVSNLVSNINGIEMNIVDHFHISVTKTFILKHHWIESFTNTVRQNVTTINKFLIIFDSLKIYCNEERTRTFIGLHTKTGYDSLAKIVEILNNCLSDFKLPHFYENPSFHMSILWCLGDKEEYLIKILPELNEIFYNLISNASIQDWYFYVKDLQCKTGNKLFNFNLS